ncbi:uncharacterized protein MONOS_18122 [Monocercomonoides exilis]|uniref:uncharacterized protein n=1 Tax=Monocercomonoides exilis TaxID=2049356 RepID=UPI00355AB916|nr:hypothetical protein MONOS_18116 [Monocercomonoides exilis]KAH7817569.1 hypothetical protein MONOS_18122 [Monocercomonoides exilis]
MIPPSNTSSTPEKVQDWTNDVCVQAEHALLCSWLFEEILVNAEDSTQTEETNGADKNGADARRSEEKVEAESSNEEHEAEAGNASALTRGETIVIAFPGIVLTFARNACVSRRKKHGGASTTR